MIDELKQEMRELQERQHDLAKKIETLENQEVLKAFEIVNKIVQEDYDFRKDDYGDEPEDVETDILNDREICLEILKWHMINIKQALGIINYQGFDISSHEATMKQIAKIEHIQYERYVGDSTFLVTLAGPDKIIVMFTDKTEGLVRLNYERGTDKQFKTISELLIILEQNRDNKGWR